MAIYDGYTKRGRISAGIGIKLHQARVIFDLVQRYTSAEIGGVLEVGPGDGYIADLAHRNGLDYDAIEGSSAVADSMEKRGYRVFRGYVPPLPNGLRESGYRACFVLHVLEHMSSPQDAAKLVSALYENLTPGGCLVIACPDYSRWGHYFYDCDYTHAYPVTTRRLSQLLVDHGFEVVHNTIYIGPVFGYIGLPIAWLAKLLYWPLLDDLIGQTKLRGLLIRGFTTFLPNLLVVARRPAI